MNFGRKARRVARRQRRRGKITRDEYNTVVEASRDPEKVAEWEAEVRKQLGAPWETQGRIDLSAIWDWFIENWPTILKILLTLLAFVEEPKTEEKSDEDE